MFNGAKGNFNIVETYIDSFMFIISNLALPFNKSYYERIVISTGQVPDGSLQPPSGIVVVCEPPVSGNSRYTYDYIYNLEENQTYTFYAYAQAVKTKWYPNGIHGQYFLMGHQTATTNRTPEYTELNIGKGFAYGATKFALETDQPCMLHPYVSEKSNNSITFNYNFPSRIRVFGTPEHVNIARLFLNHNKYDFDYVTDTPDSYNTIRRTDLVLGGPRVPGGVPLIKQNRALRLWGNTYNEVYSSIYNYMLDDIFMWVDCSFDGILTCLNIKEKRIKILPKNINIRFVDSSVLRRVLRGSDPTGDNIREIIQMIRLISI